MSNYTKAMKHARNHRKGRNMDLCLSTGTGPWKSIWSSTNYCIRCECERPTIFLDDANVCQDCRQKEATR